MTTHKICFHAEIRKIFGKPSYQLQHLKLSCLTTNDMETHAYKNYNLFPAGDIITGRRKLAENILENFSILFKSSHKKRS